MEDRELLLAIGQIVNQAVEPIKEQITGLDRHMGALEQRMDSMEQRMDSMEQRIDAMDAYAHETRTMLESMDAYAHETRDMVQSIDAYARETRAMLESIDQFARETRVVIENDVSHKISIIAEQQTRIFEEHKIMETHAAEISELKDEVWALRISTKENARKIRSLEEKVGA